jgi:catecholate siderophore receptor
MAYACMTSEILDAPPANAANIGNEVQGVPRNALSLWTTYNLSTLFDTGRGRLTAGFGVFYRDEVFTNSANVYLIPESITLDAMLSYEWDNYRLAANVYNLTNETNYDAFFNNRAIPSAGRTFTLTGSMRW